MTWEPPADVVERAAQAIWDLVDPAAIGTPESWKPEARAALVAAYPDGPDADAYRCGQVDALREAAEGSFYDGDIDQPIYGYYDLLDRADAIEREGASPTEADPWAGGLR